MSDKKIEISTGGGIFWAVALVLFWLGQCETGMRVADAIAPRAPVATPDVQ